MEELVAFLFDELAMDGRAGTSRDGFLAAIERYYLNSDDGDAPAQLVDDDYAQSVFAAMSQYSSVSVGRCVPPELPLARDDELKQADQKRGTKNKIEVNKRLDSVSIEAGASRTQYFPHQDSRIVLDEDLVRLKLTGSADTKLLSASDYLILQIIAKNRHKSTPAMEIRQKSACPTQTVFSFTKTLIEKGLVVKFSSKSQGVTSNHYLFHRYLQDNEAYQALLRGKGEIAKSAEAAVRSGSADDDNDDDGQQQEAMEQAMEADDTVIEQSFNLAANDDAGGLDDDDEGEEAEEFVDWASGDEADGEAFTRRLSKSKTAIADLSVFEDQRSFPLMSKERQETYIRYPVLLRGRLYKLMLASKNYTVIRQGLWLSLGFDHRPTAKMKMFHGIVRRQFDHGLMSEVMLGRQGNIAALRLTDKGVEAAQEDDAARMDASQRKQQAQAELQLTKAGPAYQLGIPWERQVVECIKQSKQTTSEDVALKMHHSSEAKRHIDEILASVAKESSSSSQNPAAAIDLAWDKENATYKRLKYARYTLLSAREESTIDTSEALARLTGFHSPQPSRTWSSHEELRAALLEGDTSKATSKGKAKANSGKGKGKATTPSARPAKAYTNPIDPTTNKPRKGRPRKSDGAPAKRKAADDAAGDSPPAKRGRGRPRKNAEANDSATMPGPSGTTDNTSMAVDESSTTEAEPEALAGGAVAPEQPDTSMDLADPVGLEQDTTLIEADDEDVQVAAAGLPEASPTSSPPVSPAVPRTESNGNAAAPPTDPSNNSVTGQTPAAAPTTASSRQLPAAAAASKRGQTVLAVLDFCGGVLDEYYFRRAFDAWIKSQGLDDAQAAAFKEDVGDLKDGKTRERILRLLEDQGKIKVTKTHAMGKEARGKRPAGPARKTNVLYTTSSDAATLAVYVAKVNSTSHGGDPFRESRERERAEANAQSSASIKTNGSPEAMQGASNGAPQPSAASAASASTQTVQGETSSLTERPVLEVLWDDRVRERFLRSKAALQVFYGYKQGHMARLRSVHVVIMDELARNGGDVVPASDVEAGAETAGIIDPDWLWTTAPLSLFVTIKAPVRECSELEAVLKDPQGRDRPISQQSDNIKTALAAADAESIRQFFQEQYLDWYKFMGLAKASQDDDAADDDEAAPSGSCHFQLGLWQPPFYFKIPRSAGTFTKPLATHAGRFWNFILQRVDDHSRVLTKQVTRRTVAADIPLSRILPLLRRELDDPKSWRGGFTMLKTQLDLLSRFLEDDAKVRSELKKEAVRERLSRIALVPRRVVDGYLAKHLGGVFAQQSHVSSAGASATQAGSGGEEAASTATTTQSASSPRKSQKSQARQDNTDDRRGRKDQWNDVFNTFCEDNDVEHRKDGIAEALKPYRRAFVSKKPDALSINDLKKLFAGALEAHQRPAPTVDVLADEEAEKKKKAPARKGKDKKNDEQATEEEGKKRRTRLAFDWTGENMELLRDACVIIRAREAYRASVNKNNSTNSNWKILLSLPEFAEQTTANLRSKFNSLSEAVGEEAFLAQLEEDWDILWEHFRGQPELPDEDPMKPDGFDLRTHINFLRANINKKELLIDLESDGRELPLPAGLADLKGIWHLRDGRTAQDDFDDAFKADAVTLAQKQSALHNNSFAFESSGLNISKEHHNHRLVCETVVKMLINTDDQDYATAASESVIDYVGAPSMASAINALQHRKVVRPAPRPGRSIAYQEAYSKLRKTIPSSLDQLTADGNAACHEIRGESEEAVDLVVLPDRNEGQTAVLATMIIQGEVEPLIDLAEMENLRDEKLFSAKNVQDVRLEFTIHLARVDEDQAVDDGIVELSELPEISKETTSWLPYDDGWKDLQALGWQEMTEAARTGYDKGFEEQDVLHLQAALEQAGPLGIRIDSELPSPSALAAARYVIKSSSANRPMAFASGYDVPRIISASHLPHWSVKTSILATSDDGTESASSLNSTSNYLMPRSWFDLYGRPLQDVWHTGLVQLLGHLFMRSGASRRQAILLLQPIFDRPESCDLIWALYEAGHVEIRIVSGEGQDWRCLAAINGEQSSSRQEEERRVAEKVEWETTRDDQVMLVAKRGVVKAL